MSNPVKPSLCGNSPSRAVAVSLRSKLLYGVGEVASTVKTVSLGLFTLYFYTTVMGLPGSLVGLAAAVGLVSDALLDPYIGYLSDKERIRIGHRRTLMLIGALTMGISLWAFFSPPRHLPTATLFVWLLVTGILVRATTSVYSIPYFALGAEMSQDYEERTNITAIRGGLALLGTLAAAALSFALFFPNTLPGIDPKLAYAGYPRMGLAFGAAMTIVALVPLAATSPCRFRPHRPETPVQPAAPGFLSGFIKSMQSRPFRTLLISVSLFFFAVTANSAVSIHFLTYRAQISDSSTLSGFQLAFYAGGLVGVLLWVSHGRRLSIGKRALYLAATTATSLIALAAHLWLGEGRLFGAGNALPILMGQALAGLFISVLWYMPASMIADIADADELVVGRRREGVFFGLFFFGQKVAAALAALVAGVLVDWYAGLVPGQAQQSELTIQRIGLIYGLLPAVMLLAAAAVMLRYDLTRSRVVAIRMELNEHCPSQVQQREPREA